MSREFGDLEDEIEKSKSKYVIDVKRSLEELRTDLLKMRHFAIHGKEVYE